MNAILALLGPFLVRFVSTTIAQRVAVAVAKAVLDMVEKKLVERGYKTFADLLQEIEDDVVKNPTGLVAEMQAAIGQGDTAAVRSALAASRR